MDFLVELLVQLVVQVVFELVFEYFFRRLVFRTVVPGAVSLAASRVVQYLVSIVVAVAFGIGWGHHLSGSPHRPKLLWVSLALAAGAVLLELRPQSRRATPEDERWIWSWRTVLAPPWRWPRRRLIGFALISVWIAFGIALGYKSPKHP